MCYTQEISILLATAMFAVAAYEHKTWNCWHYTLGLIYFGLMEALQAVQHSFLAVPEDGYAMCQSPTNQFLTYLGGIHICFQPFFANLIFQGLQRATSVRDRIESDFIQKLCLLAAIWYIGCYIHASYFLGEWAPAATKECPNYHWMRDGYDEALDFTTPNLPGKPCTYKSPTEQGHLAWVFPNFHTSYYQPTVALHFYIFFGPALVMLLSPSKPQRIMGVLAILCFLLGPFLISFITPSVNEQPAVWCYRSVGQVISHAMVYRWYGIPQQQLNTKQQGQQEKIVLEGKWGEKPIVYYECLEGKQQQGTATNHDDDKNKDIHRPLLSKDNTPPPPSTSSSDS